MNLGEKLLKKYGEEFRLFLKDSKSNTFKFGKNEMLNVEKEVNLFLRDQPGWEKVWQKIFTTDDSGMSIGISIVEPGGGGEPEEVKSDFIDFILVGKGELTVEGVGKFEIKEGDFLDMRKGIRRGFRNTGDTLFISIYGIGTTPSYNKEGEKNEKE